MPLEFYYEALKILKAKLGPVSIIAFSDDIEWVKHHFTPGDPIDFVVPGPELDDLSRLFLISHCRHQVIANSTFSWWGAYLNRHPAKIVVAPEQWTKKDRSQDLGILPASWLTL